MASWCALGVGLPGVFEVAAGEPDGFRDQVGRGDPGVAQGLGASCRGAQWRGGVGEGQAVGAGMFAEEPGRDRKSLAHGGESGPAAGCQQPRRPPDPTFASARDRDCPQLTASWHTPEHQAWRWPSRFATGGRCARHAGAADPYGNPWLPQFVQAARERGDLRWGAVATNSLTCRKADVA